MGSLHLHHLPLLILLNPKPLDPTRRPSGDGYFTDGERRGDRREGLIGEYL